MIPEEPLERWTRARSEAPVPEGFVDRVVASVPGRPRVLPSLPWIARAALLLVGLGAFLFRLGSVLALLWAS